MNKIERFRNIVNSMADLYEQKNKNYGDSFGQLYDELGPIAGLVPLYNKLHRATSLIKGNENKFESLEDTFKDLACYAVMNLIAMYEEQDSHTQYFSANDELNDILNEMDKYTTMLGGLPDETTNEDNDSENDEDDVLNMSYLQRKAYYADQYDKELKEKK